ncbi:nuclear pore glycoprotein p62-like [Palaemon carinicauda]|uniref:nuclear pore glycoprotein p62-like n=1 Tax=Palaemon carinicauda TaxID=392227 RepID=UPI0035B57C3C
MVVADNGSLDTGIFGTPRSEEVLTVTPLLRYEFLCVAPPTTSAISPMHSLFGYSPRSHGMTGCNSPKGGVPGIPVSNCTYLSLGMHGNMESGAYPESVREMSRLLQEAVLTQDAPTPPESPNHSPAVTPTPWHQSSSQDDTKDVKCANEGCAEGAPAEGTESGGELAGDSGGGGKEDVGVIRGDGDMGGMCEGGADCSARLASSPTSSTATATGPVSLSQILARPVYTVGASLPSTLASSLAGTSSSSSSSSSPYSSSSPSSLGTSTTTSSSPNDTQTQPAHTTSSPTPARAHYQGPRAAQPSSPMPVAVMGNGTSGQTGGHHHHNHHHHGNTPGGALPGNGRAVPKPVYPEDYNYLKGLVPELKSDVRERDLKIDVLEAETLDLRRQLKRKTEEMTRLQREVHKLKIFDKVLGTPQATRNSSA